MLRCSPPDKEPPPQSICCITTWYPGVPGTHQMVRFALSPPPQDCWGCGDINTSVNPSELLFWSVSIEAEQLFCSLKNIWWWPYTSSTQQQYCKSHFSHEPSSLNSTPLKPPSSFLDVWGLFIKTNISVTQDLKGRIHFGLSWISVLIRKSLFLSMATFHDFIFFLSQWT